METTRSGESGFRRGGVSWVTVARSVAIIAWMLGRPAAALAQPEAGGPYEVGVWSNSPEPPIPIAQGVFYPLDASCPGAPVVLSHGAGESGAFKVEMARLMASHGLIAVAPSFPSYLVNPTQAEGQRVNELLAWIVAQGEDPSSPLHGLVDGSRLGVAGHSNGGVVYHAAATNPDIAAVIGWDAVAMLDQAEEFHGASLHLLADGTECGGGSTRGYDLAPEPKALATVTASSHCDYNDPASPLCVGVCGTPPYNPTAAAMVERYSVAWFVCLLGHDPSMQQYLAFDGELEGLSGTALAGAIQCREAACEDDGSDAGVSDTDEGSGGCGCSTLGAAPHSPAMPWSLALLALLLRRARRRREPGAPGSDAAKRTGVQGARRVLHHLGDRCVASRYTYPCRRIHVPAHRRLRGPRSRRE